MKKLITIILISLFVTSSASAAVDMFLKIEGIKGESTDEAHVDEIDVLAWSLNLNRTGAGVACTSGISITKYTDKATMPLTETLGMEEPREFDTAVLTIRKGGDIRLDFLVYTMEVVRVTSYVTGGSGEEG